MLGIRNGPLWVKATLAVLGFSSALACGGAQSTTESDVREHIDDLEAGGEVSFETMVADLVTARVVYVAESHDDPAHHRAQLEILRALHGRNPSLALGVEMVQRPFQSSLDAFVRGEGDEAALLEGVEWEERWGFDFALYRAIFVFCREHGIPIVALNARKELTRAVARQGLDGLDETLRAELPELDLGVSAHREMIEAALAEHPNMTPGFFERMYAAQVVWDETMATRTAETLSGDDAPALMLVIAGQFHVRGGVGIPDRAARRGATPYRIVLPVSGDDHPIPPGPSAPGRYRWVLSSRPQTP
jgi:uncharacterized iron-regulated protein